MRNIFGWMAASLAVTMFVSTNQIDGQTPLVPQEAWAMRPTLQVWPGVAPGSEKDQRKESIMLAPIPPGTGLHILRNVTTPTLTVFQPAGGNTTRTAVLICPGGGFRVLAIDEEGYQVADWFVQHGVTAYVLKYRLAPTPESDLEFAPPNESPQEGIKRILSPLPDAEVPEAIADGIQALKVVRDHAAAYGYSADRVVALGFSAGGAVVTGTGLAVKPSDRPNYVAPIYGAILTPKVDVPSGAPPFFLAVAEDDPLVKPMVFRLFDALRTAGATPEFHVYHSGQHGFSMKERGTSDHWLEELWWWMKSYGLTSL